MTIHLVAPSPHSETTHRFDVDAFAAKCRRLATMLTDQGYNVILYGAGDKTDSRVGEYVPLVSSAEQTEWFDGFDPMVSVWNTWDGRHFEEYNRRAIKAIQGRWEPDYHDILGLTMGVAHKPIADAFPANLMPVVETGIGYPGVFAPYRVFESYAWAHYLAEKPIGMTRFFDAVIPNSYDAEEFPEGNGQGGYHLFIGRFNRNKGVEIAVEATERLGVKLIMAGPGVTAIEGNRICGNDVEVYGDHIEHIGSVTGETKARLMGEAAAVWAPTTYLEPFGSVVTEAMTTGTPVITTDWGAFTETVQPGVGFRCRTLAEFVEAGRRAKDLDRHAIRQYALSRYSTKVCGPLYASYLAKIETLWGEGWYTP